MGIYKSQLSQCQIVENKFLSLKDECISLHREVTMLGLLDLKAFNLDKKVRQLEIEARGYSMQMKAVNKSLQSLQNDINLNNQVPQETFDEVKKISELTNIISAYQRDSEIYIIQMRDYLSSHSVWGAIIEMWRDLLLVIKDTAIFVVRATLLVVKGVPFSRSLMGRIIDRILPPGRN